AEARAADVVALVNPDIECRPGILDSLIGQAIARDNIGVVTCQLRTRDGRPQREPFRPSPRLLRLAAARLVPTALHKRRRVVADDHAAQVPRAVECTM